MTATIDMRRRKSSVTCDAVLRAVRRYHNSTGHYPKRVLMRPEQRQEFYGALSMLPLLSGQPAKWHGVLVSCTGDPKDDDPETARPGSWEKQIDG